MKEKDLNKILGVFANGTELNLGIYPNTIVVNYGYDYTEKELTLYIQGSGKEIEKIKNYVEKNNAAHFNKWSKDGVFISGEGNAKILTTEEEKLKGLKKIMEQQTETERNSNVDKNEIINLFLLEITVKNIDVIKY